MHDLITVIVNPSSDSQEVEDQIQLGFRSDGFEDMEIRRQLESGRFKLKFKKALHESIAHF